MELASFTRIKGKIWPISYGMRLNFLPLQESLISNLNLRSDVEQNLKYFWENIRGDMDMQAINTDYGVIPSEQEFDFETSFDFSSIMMIGSTSNAKRCLNDDGTVCQVIFNVIT